MKYCFIIFYTWRILLQCLFLLIIYKDMGLVNHKKKLYLVPSFGSGLGHFCPLSRYNFHYIRWKPLDSQLGYPSLWSLPRSVLKDYSQRTSSLYSYALFGLFKLYISILLCPLFHLPAQGGRPLWTIHNCIFSSLFLCLLN